MPAYFVKFRELNHHQVVVLHNKEYRTWQVVKPVDAADEATIHKHAARLSQNEVEILEIRLMTKDEAYIFDDRIDLT